MYSISSKVGGVIFEGVNPLKSISNKTFWLLNPLPKLTSFPVQVWFIR